MMMMMMMTMRAWMTMMLMMMCVGGVVNAPLGVEAQTSVTPSATSRDPNRFGVDPERRSGAASAMFTTGATYKRLVVFGGLYDGNALADLWELDIVKDATSGEYGNWTRLHDGSGTDAPWGRTGAMACALGGNLYVFGGYSPGYGDFDELWKFDRTAESWSRVEASDGVVPPKRNGGTMTTPDGESGSTFLIFGGNGLNDVWEFDISTMTWTMVRSSTVSSGVLRAYAWTLSTTVVVLVSLLASPA